MTREDYAIINEHLTNEQLSNILYDTITKYEEQLKSKDEEIERLKANKTPDCVDAYFIDYGRANSKARSVVAMLFWEWRKSEARIYATNIKWNTGRAFQSQILFEAAYKILKEQQ